MYSYFWGLKYVFIEYFYRLPSIFEQSLRMSAWDVPGIVLFWIDLLGSAENLFLLSLKRKSLSFPLSLFSIPILLSKCWSGPFDSFTRGLQLSRCHKAEWHKGISLSNSSNLDKKNVENCKDYTKIVMTAGTLRARGQLTSLTFRNCNMKMQ